PATSVPSPRPSRALPCTGRGSAGSLETMAAAARSRPHPTLTRSLRLSKVFGPMPLTSSRSSTAAKGWVCRWLMIASAVTGPTPGSVCRAVASAVLRSTLPDCPAAPGPAPLLSAAVPGSPPFEPAEPPVPFVPASPVAGILSVGAGVLTFLGNVDLLTVGEHPGQIHRIRGGVALQPACGLDGVLDPRTGGECHHRGMSHRAGDVDDHLSRRRRRGGP